MKLKVLFLWHVNDCLTALAAGRESERNGISDLLNQALLEILHEHVANALLDVALEKDHSVTSEPALDASMECGLKLDHGVTERALNVHHGVTVHSGDGEWVLGGG